MDINFGLLFGMFMFVVKSVLSCVCGVGFDISFKLYKL